MLLLSAKCEMLVVDMVVVGREVPSLLRMLTLWLSAECEMFVVDMAIVGRDIPLLVVYVDVVVVG